MDEYDTDSCCICCCSAEEHDVEEELLQSKYIESLGFLSVPEVKEKIQYTRKEFIT